MRPEAGGLHELKHSVDALLKELQKQDQAMDDQVNLLRKAQADNNQAAGKIAEANNALMAELRRQRMQRPAKPEEPKPAPPPKNDLTGSPTTADLGASRPKAQPK